MPIAADFSVATNGNIRYIGAAHGASGAGGSANITRISDE